MIAHRGASATVPEHTLAAYERALHDGADGLECDVRLTADGHVVCVHDRRINRTSNGRGVLSTMTLADLDSHDFGSWMDASGAQLDGDAVMVDESRHRVLTLERLLDLVRDAGRPVELAVETKHPTRYAGLVEQRVVEVLRRHGFVGTQRAPHPVSVRVMSFSTLSLRRMRALAPRVPTVYLMERIPLRLRDGDLPFAAAVAGPSIDAIRADPGYVRRAHARGYPTHVWTVDDPADVALCVELGVDAIITNRPSAVLEQLGRAAGGAPTVTT